MDYTRDDERAFWQGQNILLYEIRKNEKKIEDWESEGATDHVQEAARLALIADAKRRIDVLNARLIEVEEREGAYRTRELDDCV